MVKFRDEIKGNRIFLQIKKAEISLAKNIFEVLNENREYLEEYLDWVQETTSLDQTIKLIQDYVKGFEKLY